MSVLVSKFEEIKMQRRVKNRTIEKIVITATIAAIYVALTAISSAFGLAFSVVQFRLSEVLTVLPVFSPYAVAGLTLGCFISNLASPFGIFDMIFGTLSTLIAAYLTRKLSCVTFKNIPILALLPPVLVGAVIVGAMIAFLLPEGFSAYAFIFSAMSVGIGQFVVCYGLGIPLFFLIRKLQIFKDKQS